MNECVDLKSFVFKSKRFMREDAFAFQCFRIRVCA